MSIGLVALLDDVAAIAKVAAASLDDIAGQAAKSGAKAAGVVIDDAAVTPRYVVGFSPARELPIVWKIARGSLRNKLLILLPAALALSLLAPWLITPLLMLGGAYLCYEGAEKLFEAIWPHEAHAHEAALGETAADSAALEAQKVAGAVRTDFILSAEIMAITLASLPEGSLWMRALVLAVVGIGITMLVYGGVALIVKADDAGLAMARNGNGSALGSLTRGFGRGLVKAMPYFLRLPRCGRHGRDDLGRRRHHRAWVGGLWPLRHRPFHPRRSGCGGPDRPLVRRRGRMAGQRRRLRARRPGCRGGADPARLLWAGAGLGGDPAALSQLSPPGCDHRRASPRAAPAPPPRIPRSCWIRLRYG